jgi:two-component system, cell cycle sensor histidine kinase and response regulator CckA
MSPRQPGSREDRRDAEIADLRAQLAEARTALAAAGVGARTAGLHAGVADMRRAADELERTRDTLLEAQRIAHMGSFEYDAATRTAVGSEEAYRILGLDPNEPAPSFEELIAGYVHPEDAALFSERAARARESRSSYDIEHRIVRPDGEVRWVYQCVQPQFDERGELCRYVGTTLDITARKQAEAALRESEERFRALVQASSDAVYRMSPCWTEMRHLVGRDFVEDTTESSDSWLDRYIPADDRPRVTAAIDEAIRAKSVFELEHRVRRPDGGIGWTFWRAVPILDARGEITDWVGMATDITARREMEERLKTRDITERLQAEQERARLSNAIEQSGEAVVITDPEARIQYVNSAFEKNSGYTRAEAMGQTPRFLASGRHDAGFYENMWRSLGQDGVWRGRFINRHKQGRLVLEDTTISAIRDAEGRVINYVAVKRDVTHEVQLAAQLRQAQKLEAIGQLAGGIAHDFNNLLAAIMMQVGMLRRSPHLEPETAEALADMDRTAERGAALVRQMLLFSRRTAASLQTLDLNEAIDDLVKMLRRLIPENVQLRFDAGADLPKVDADPGLLQQVLTNLVVNARDAMPRGGAIAITTTAKRFGDEDCRANPQCRPGAFLCLAVADNGCGMDAETSARAFEPFFTTKGVGRGTGLGLATVHGIVGQHHGWVTLESEAGRGTTFRVYLPASTKVAPAGGQATAARWVPRGTETVLLVEDDPDVQRSVARVLRHLGFRVEEASNGEEALRLWPAMAAEVDVVLTDMVMPGSVDGLQLAEQLRAVKPGLRVIVSSGYSEDLPGAGRPPVAGVLFLPKPYQMATLADLLRQCLDGGTDDDSTGA